MDLDNFGTFLFNIYSFQSIIPSNLYFINNNIIFYLGYYQNLHTYIYMDINNYHHK